MTEDITYDLGKETPSAFHVELLTHAKALIKMSRADMSAHYLDWDMQDQVYRGERYLDNDDVKQAVKGKPVKMVVPNTFAQVMTFASFLFLMFKQNNTFFEFNPTGNEDYGDKEKDTELMMERDLRHNSWSRVLFQHLLDVGRFGPSILECAWTRKITRAYVENPPQVVTYQGVNHELRSGSEWREYVKYEGNLVRPISPYRFFPDTRFPLVDFQKGEFCAIEEEYSKASLRELEAAGEVQGVDWIQPMPADWSKMRGGETRLNFDTTRGNLDLNSPYAFIGGPSQSEGTVLVTKSQLWLVPSKFMIDGKKMGPEEFPILHHLWYANDQRVIRCEPAGWWHNQFGWSMSHFTPDMHRTLSLGLADLIYRLQDVITWHINSRITDVRRNMRGRLIVDPQGIETSTLDGEGDILMRHSASKSGADRWIKQLEMRDTTQGHMADAELLGKIMQLITGVNDNLMGQYNSGRRSAQEARTVLGGAAGRMKLHGHLIWGEGFEPLGKMMLSNSRQALPFTEFAKVIGTSIDDPNEVQARYKAYKGTPEEVITGDDYFVFDSTLASEKGFTAQSLQDLLSTVIQSDPHAAERLSAKIDPAKILDEIQYLRGAGNVKRFRYTPEEQAQIEAEQKQRFLLQNQPPPPPPPSLSLSGKMTPSQEEAAARKAGIEGKPGEKPQPTGAAAQ